MQARQSPCQACFQREWQNLLSEQCLNRYVLWSSHQSFKQQFRENLLPIILLHCFWVLFLSLAGTTLSQGARRVHSIRHWGILRETDNLSCKIAMLYLTRNTLLCLADPACTRTLMFSRQFNAFHVLLTRPCDLSDRALSMMTEIHAET